MAFLSAFLVPLLLLHPHPEAKMPSNPSLPGFGARNRRERIFFRSQSGPRARRCCGRAGVPPSSLRARLLSVRPEHGQRHLQTHGLCQCILEGLYLWFRIWHSVCGSGLQGLGVRVVSAWGLGRMELCRIALSVGPGILISSAHTDTRMQCPLCIA